jgi:transcriptional regulator with XRE-family HTH domain
MEDLIMFQTKNTGLKISQLRKEKNITQMELADLMGVSYQAVSNWERGNSMPDISKLPELSEILEVSIDELLIDGKPLELVKNIINGTENEYIDEEKISIDTVAEVAPILKPKQTDEIVGKVIEANEGNKEAISFNDILSIAPFLSREKLDKLALDFYTSDDIHELQSLAPFVSREVLNTFAEKASSEGNLSDLIGLAPFLSRDILDKLVLKYYDNEGLNKLVSFAPFISKDTLNKLAVSAFDNGSIEQLVPFAPFLSKDVIGELVLNSSNKISKSALMSLAPFIKREILNKIVDKYVYNYGLKEIKDIISFL